MAGKKGGGGKGAGAKGGQQQAPQNRGQRVKVDPDVVATFSTIKHVPGKDTTLAFSQTDPKGTVKTTTISSKESPEEDLPNALKGFIPLVAEAMELPEEWEQTMLVTTLHLGVEQSKGKPNRRNCIITFRHKAEAFNSSAVINTPVLREAQSEEEEGNPGFLPDEWLEQIAKCEAAASRFVRGERAQLDAFAQNAANNGTTEADEREPGAQMQDGPEYREISNDEFDGPAPKLDDAAAADIRQAAQLSD